MNYSWNKRSYNPMMVKNFVYYMDGDEKKGIIQQRRIEQQEERIEQLEEAIQEALAWGHGYVIDCAIDMDEMVRPMVEGGKHITEFIVD